MPTAMRLRLRARTPPYPPEGARTHLGAGVCASARAGCAGWESNPYRPEGQERRKMEDRANNRVQVKRKGAGVSRNSRAAYKKIRREFHRKIAAMVPMPTRPTEDWGMAWPARNRRWVFNSLVVRSHDGSFELDRDTNPIPRVFLNRLWWPQSRRQILRWTGVEAGSLRMDVSHRALTLTVAIEELLDFAPWLLAWLEAVERRDASLMPKPPHALQGTPDAEDLLFSRFEWTVAAHEEHGRRRKQDCREPSADLRTTAKMPMPEDQVRV